MLTKQPSIASLLVKQSPSPHFGHGWIMGKDGKRWHPCRSQDALPEGLTGNRKRMSWLSKLKISLSI
ncbi:phage filamentation protein Fil family protein [Klebsiella pneumoniae]